MNEYQKGNLHWGFLVCLPTNQYGFDHCLNEYQKGNLHWGFLVCLPTNQYGFLDVLKLFDIWDYFIIKKCNSYPPI